ncbi:MAG: cytochrome c peroxidase [Campylobacterota bacterium]|nr:cytochrome c peroxidase [Campylobacterota bacterium]
MMKYLMILTISVYLYANSIITPIPTSVKYDKQKALIGKSVFFGKELPENLYMCHTCHIAKNGMSVDRIIHLTLKGKKVPLSSISLYNRVFNRYYTYEGSTKSLYEIVHKSLHNFEEMKVEHNDFMSMMNSSNYYKEKFRKVFKKEAISSEMVSQSVTEFIKALITPNAKFDKYLRGEVELSRDEYEGYLTFKRLGCITCHNGVNIGGNSFQKLGATVELEYKHTTDRYQITGDEEDRYTFIVPSLRNIELSAPYFHDGRKQTLKDAVSLMSHHNLAYELTAKEKELIVEFLKTLTGELPGILNEK